LGAGGKRGALLVEPGGQVDGGPDLGSSALGLPVGEQAALGPSSESAQLVPDGEAHEDVVPADNLIRAGDRPAETLHGNGHDPWMLSASTA
jgi:hypothetical protein